MEALEGFEVAAFSDSEEEIEPLDGSFEELSDGNDTGFPEERNDDDNKAGEFTNVVEKEVVVTSCFDENSTSTKDTIPTDEATYKLKKLKCTHCSQMVSFKSMARHVRKHKGENMKCRHCPATFYENYDLSVHEKSHSCPFVCDVCGKRVTTRSGLRRHVQDHTEKRPISCELCPMTFRTKQHYEGHRNSQHLQYKPFKCTTCDKAFAYQQNLSRHKQGCLNDEKNHTCGECGNTFKTKRAMDEHAKAKHSNEGIRCKCGRMYKWKRSYNRHRLTCRN